MYIIRLEKRSDYTPVATLSINADLRTLRDICEPLSELYLVRTFQQNVVFKQFEIGADDQALEITEPADLTPAKRSELERYFRSISDLCHRAGSQIEFGAHMLDMALDVMDKLEKMQAKSEAMQTEYDHMKHRLEGLDK